MFLVLEGVEGSGKSTHARLLGEWLQSRNIPAIVTREPGGTAIGEEIRQIVLHGHEMPAEAELLLMNAARCVFVSEVVKPAIEQGKVVVADRFSLSSMAYQGFGRGLALDQVRTICSFASGGLSPDLTIVIEVPVEIGATRRATRSGPDRIESAGTEFHNRVAEAYRLLPDSEPHVVGISGTGSIDDVQQRIRALLAGRFPETFAGSLG